MRYVLFLYHNVGEGNNIMKIIYSNVNKGMIEKISAGKFDIPFGKGLGPSLYIRKGGKDISVKFSLQDEEYTGLSEGIVFRMKHAEAKDYVVISIQIENRSGQDFAPEDLYLTLGLDTYMGEYPERNQAFFPTMLRCEKTHFYGYFMSPAGGICAVASPDPIASYSLQYCRTESEDEFEGEYGHRINTASLSFLHKGPLPERHPEKVDILGSGDVKKYHIYFISLGSLDWYSKKVSAICKIPIITSDLYTLPRGGDIHFRVDSEDDYSISYFGPNGSLERIISGGTRGSDTYSFVMNEFGVYSVIVKTQGGKIAEAKFYCRKPWEWYLKQARKEAIAKPQRATTHAESWYGFFSGFLAAKHYPDWKLDTQLLANFEEIIPLMFDFDAIQPWVIPERIQNTATLISLLVDKYEVETENNRKDLMLASKFGDWLMTKQGNDGGYYKNNILYTCVIYIAKSMLELAEAERCAGMAAESARHYASAAQAVCQLSDKLDDIETEGEQTFEDGMIISSAMQIAMYALTLPEDQRGKFTQAAEYMDRLHGCLEQRLIPDCRMNGGSLRFWEAQYDIMFIANFVGSPHGWSAWTAYAKYYLYLLTGRERYLIELFNTVGACIQLMSLEGELRWAFAVDPYIHAKRLIPDTDQPIIDGYSSVTLDSLAYRGKFVDEVSGEEYLDMVSGWYRTGEQRLTGGYVGCPLIWPDRLENVDHQGGACDNDVHEIFKCLEETLLKKAFIIERDNGEIYGYNCAVIRSLNILEVNLFEETEWIHTNLKNAYSLKGENWEISREVGLWMDSIKK